MADGGTLAAPLHEVAVRKQREREAILQRFAEWRPEPVDGAVRDVRDLASARLSEHERGIVTADATRIVQQIGAGTWSAEEVLTAFAKVAVAAQDLTNCLTEIFIDEGLARARELDAHFRATGTVVGPLHGLPVRRRDRRSDSRLG